MDVGGLPLGLRLREAIVLHVLVPSRLPALPRQQAGS